MYPKYNICYPETKHVKHSKSVKQDLQGLDFPSINFLLADFIKNIHSDTETISEIIIEPNIDAEQVVDSDENSVFTPNPLEFETFAVNQDATISFTEFPSEETSLIFATNTDTTSTNENQSNFLSSLQRSKSKSKILFNLYRDKTCFQR